MLLFDIRPFRDYIEEQYSYNPNTVQNHVIPLQKYMQSSKKLDVLDTEKGTFSIIICKDLCSKLIENGQFGNLILQDKNSAVVGKPQSLHRVFFKLGNSYYQILENINGYDYIVAWQDNKVYFVQFFSDFFCNIFGISTIRSKFQLWKLSVTTGKLDFLFSCYLNLEELKKQNACLFREMTEEDFIRSCKSGFFEVVLKIGHL